MYIKDLTSFQEAMKSLEDYRGISKDVIIESIKDGISSACIKTYGNGEIEVDIDENYVIKIYRVKKVVEIVEDSAMEISLADAQAINSESALGDEILLEEQSEDFRRNAILNAKQIITQRVREAERNNVLEKFENKKGTILTGVIRRIDTAGNVFIDLENIETILGSKEQSPLDRYRVGDIIKVVVVDILSNAKMPKVLISRKSSSLVKELFAFEVPEIADGTIEIKAIAREAGFRTKIAISTDSEAIDPIGACVGNRSMRIKSIINELSGEKIDIVLWDDDIKLFIANALKPAEVEKISINDTPEHRYATVKVKEDQLSLAIGKKGQNTRLAARLSGCKINIESI